MDQRLSVNLTAFSGPAVSGTITLTCDTRHYRKSQYADFKPKLIDGGKRPPTIGL
jgi:hypothetical protein